jgi:hypothetical protein
VGGVGADAAHAGSANAAAAAVARYRFAMDRMYDMNRPLLCIGRSRKRTIETAECSDKGAEMRRPRERS